MTKHFLKEPIVGMGLPNVSDVYVDAFCAEFHM